MKRDVHAGIQNQEWHEHQDHKRWHWRILILAVIVSVAAAGTSVKIASNEEQKAAWGLTLNAAKAQTNICNVLDYGARGDGYTDDTDAIQAAIDDCSGRSGGQVVQVLFPPGMYIARGLDIQDHVTLKLDGKEMGDVVIKGIGGSAPGDSIGPIRTSNQRNIGIEGPGTIDRGPGGSPSKAPDWDEHDTWYWKHIIYFVSCSGVVIKDIVITSDKYGTEYVGVQLGTSDCENVVYDNVVIKTNQDANSNDSVSNSCGGRNITIKNSSIHAGDDNMVFHGTYSGCQNTNGGNTDFDGFLLQDVYMDGHNTQGGVMMTTGGNGDPDGSWQSNMTFDNIIIDDALSSWGWGHGISISPREGNVKYRNITFSNITMRGDVPKPFHAIFPYCYTNPSYSCDMDGVDGDDIRFQNIDIYRDKNAHRDEPSEIQKMDNVIFENITYYYPSGQNIPKPLVYFREINGLCVNNFRIVQGGNEIPNPNSFLSIASDVNGVSFDQPCQFNGCNCTAWQDLSCGGGSCQPSQLCQTRTCDPAGCDNESRCISDPSCGVSEDINLDGKIDILDLQLAINVLLGLEKDNAIIARADVNRDGQVNRTDIQQIGSRILSRR